MRKKAASHQEPAKVLNASHEPAVRKVKVESNTVKGSKELELLVPNKYYNLAASEVKEDCPCAFQGEERWVS